MGRFRTGKGRLVDWVRLPNLLTSLCQAVVRKLTGRIPRQPWIPFAATKALGKVIQRDWRVWEIGSGYSTLWLSDRAGKITSIEASKEWYERLSKAIERERLANVDLRYEWVRERMADFSELADESLDLLFIDGGPRDLCLTQGFAKVKRGGLLYLDNWDNDKYWGDSRSYLTDHAAEILDITSLVDYVPAQVGVYEGLLIKKA
jgi:predicted O-methyltransferase YrrM